VLRVWLLPAVNTSQTLEFGAKALYANRDTVDASALIINKAIGFHRPGLASMVISASAARFSRAARRRAAFALPGQKQARRTTTDKNRLYFTSLG
jgi:hypothetical protein